MGKLIVIEGLDSSGKETQSRLLFERIKQSGKKAGRFEFPNYKSNSSALVKMYLAGEFGTEAGSVGAYAASSFYAVDRYASFMRHWKEEYESDFVILADRYTTSNCVHQCSKLPRDKWDEYIEWLYNYEFGLLSIPKPDLVIFLDMDPAISQRLMSERYKGDEAKKDIHEKDTDYLAKCREAAFYSADKLDWKVVKCYEGDEPKPIEQIAETIYQELQGVL